MIIIKPPKEVGQTTHYNIPVESESTHKANVLFTEDEKSGRVEISFIHSHPSCVSGKEKDEENSFVEKAFVEWYKQEYIVQLTKSPINTRG